LEAETVIKISFESLELFSTNHQWKPDVTHSSDDFQYKKLKINGFGINLVTLSDLKIKADIPKMRKKPSKTEVFSDGTFNTIRKKPGIHNDYLRQEYTEKTYKTLKEMKNMFFLMRPIDIRLKITVLSIKKTKSIDEFEDSKLNFSLFFKNPLIIMLNKQQRQYLMNLGKHMKALEMVRSNLHIRPTVLFRNNRLEWFRYAVKATIEQNKKIKLNFKKSTQKLTMQKKYMTLYKKKQTIVKKIRKI